VEQASNLIGIVLLSAIAFGGSVGDRLAPVFVSCRFTQQQFCPAQIFIKSSLHSTEEQSTLSLVHQPSNNQ
jgi:hypothetical protein